jgi:hypothetical protein
MAYKYFSTITNVSIHYAHKYYTVWVKLQCDQCVTSLCFGGLSLSSYSTGYIDTFLIYEYLGKLYEIFNVSSREEMCGKQCYALSHFDDDQYNICGIETLDGKRFTNYEFSKAFLNCVQAPLEKATERCKRKILFLQQSLDLEIELLNNLEKSFKDW